MQGQNSDITPSEEAGEAGPFPVDPSDMASSEHPAVTSGHISHIAQELPLPALQHS